MTLRLPLPSLRIDLRRWVLLDKKDVAYWTFFAGIMTAYLGSLHPWFLWPLMELYPILASMFITVSFLVANSMEESIYNRPGFMLPLLACVLLLFYIVIINQFPLSAYVVALFSLPVMAAVLRVDLNILQRCFDDIARAMAGGLAISAVAFLLYLLGFNFPSRDVVYGDNFYSFTNYFFFMVDDRFIWAIIPRFHSVFLEPGHLGTATALLLMTQMGRWKRWYNVVLIGISLITFSLAAYAFLVALAFCNLWVQRKRFIGKLIAMIILLGAFVGGAFVYNDGDNLVHDLILMRLEVDDETGDIEGNNRVTDDFKAEFESYMTSGDVLFGRDMSSVGGEGNSGYRVFIYENGLVGLALVIVFYVLSFQHYSDVRCLGTAILLSLLVFWSRGYPLWFSIFIPILVTALRGDLLQLSKPRDS